MFRKDIRENPGNFRAMFDDVFGGGKADLILSDENDIPESGIEIVARPPEQTVAGHFIAVRRRTDNGRRVAVVFHLSGQTEPVLRAGRAGCATGRQSEHQPVCLIYAAISRAFQFIIITH